MNTRTEQVVTKPVPNADPRFTIRRHIVGYAYAANGNTHNPTPRYRWHLLVDGILVDSDDKRAPLVAAARERGCDYLAEIDARNANIVKMRWLAAHCARRTA